MKRDPNDEFAPGGRNEGARPTRRPFGEWLRAHRADVKSTRDTLRAIETRWTWGRFALFFGAAGAWVILGTQPAVAGMVSSALLAGFVWAVRRHRRIRAARELADRTLVVIDEAILRSAGRVTLIRSWERPTGPIDPNAELAPILSMGRTFSLSDQERDDLDLFSRPVGVFGLLNRTSTALGARRLCDMFDRPSLSVEHIRARQETVRRMSEQPAERIRLMAAVADLRHRDASLDQLVGALRQANPVPKSFISPALQVWSLLTALFAIVVAVDVALGGLVLLFALIALWGLNGLIFLRMRPALRERLDPWRTLVPVLRGYLAAARQGMTDLPDVTELASLRDRLSMASDREVLPALSRRVPWADTGGVFHAVFNTLLFYDLHIAKLILSTVLSHRDRLLGGLSALADLEALMSLACFAVEQPVACWPEPLADSGLSIAGALHPLIAPERSVPNDIVLTPHSRVWVVTGSNMSGKSTLLRATGISALLAQMGSAVTARKMVFSPVRLITDLRACDNLARDESYYLAEVRQLRRMICPPPDDAPVLGLIDEPFRGTNSDEQVAASLAVLRHLVESSDFFILATHERMLTELANGERAGNFHFRENLDSEGLTFDYVLRPGPARTRNAIRILERERYPDDIVDDARRRLAASDDPPTQ